MKPYPLRLLTVALAADFASSFAPSHRRAPALGHATKDPRRVFASVEVESSASSTDEVFSDDDASVRSAYDDWRTTFGKGEFDPLRFENFKTNFKMLTVANVKAREQAISEGRPQPAWMSLNKYGDFSQAEYESMKKESSLRPLPTAADATVNDFSDSQLPPNMSSEDVEIIREMERALEEVARVMSSIASPSSDPERGDREAKLRALSEECPKAYEEWCAEYGKEPDPNRFAAFSNNYLAMRLFTEKTGRKKKLNQYADCTREEYNRLMQGAFPEELDNQRKASEEQRTEAARLSEIQAPARGTQLIKGTDQSPGRSTEVIRSARATMALQPSGQPLVRPTEVVRRANQPSVSPPEEAVPNAGQPGRKTLLIDDNTDESADDVGVDGLARGTTVIGRADGEPVRGTSRTMVVKKGGSNNRAAGRGTFVVKKSQEENESQSEDDISVRGTIVIKRQILEPSERLNSDDVRRGTIVISGSQDVQKSPSQYVRGTIVLQRNGAQSIANVGRATVCIPKAELGGAAPSVFSFFGGTKKDDAVSRRGTIVIKKQKSDGKPKIPPSSATVADSITIEEPGVVTEEIAEVRRWWQAVDGTITGFIYNSKDFKDGTKLTTNAVPIGVKQGSVVKTGSGHSYLLN